MSRRAATTCLVLIIVAAFISAIRNKKKFEAPRSAVTASSTAVALPEDQRVYLGAALSYLQEANSEATTLAQTMAATNDGSATLSDVRDSLAFAKDLDNTGYTVDYRQKFGGHVPALFTADGQRIDEVHRLFQSASKETLAYWDDQNTEHISSGMATLKRCVQKMNVAIASLNRKMDTLAKSKR